MNQQRRQRSVAKFRRDFLQTLSDELLPFDIPTSIVSQPAVGAPGRLIDAADQDASAAIQQVIQRSNEEQAQAIARTGKVRLKEWLERLDYGNADISGGVDLFWLQGGLRISAMEQVGFVHRLAEGRLTATQRSQRLVRDALVVERTSAYTLYAKTGSSSLSIRDCSPLCSASGSSVPEPSRSRSPLSASIRAR